MSSKQNEEKLLETFKMFDKNHDGILSIEELREGFKEFLGDQIMFEDELQGILKKIDLNQNGMIEYSEFIAAASNIQQLLTEKNLKQAFDLFDLDANGQITPRELKHILGAKNADIKDEDWEMIIAEYDKNGDGMINFSEFKNMMFNIHHRRQSLLLMQPMALIEGLT